MGRAVLHRNGISSSVSSFSAWLQLHSPSTLRSPWDLGSLFIFIFVVASLELGKYKTALIRKLIVTALAQDNVYDRYWLRWFGLEFRPGPPKRSAENLNFGRQGVFGEEIMFTKSWRGVSPASLEVRHVLLAQRTAERSSSKVGKRFFEEIQGKQVGEVRCGKRDFVQ